MGNIFPVRSSTDTYTRLILEKKRGGEEKGKGSGPCIDLDLMVDHLEWSAQRYGSRWRE